VLYQCHVGLFLDILTDVIESQGLNANLVSASDDVGIIQKRIVQNIYSNKLVICDVSAKNPNVMFELGMRLAFDKPTIIVKDEQTDYSFDTSPIEHLDYPRDLRFSKINDFKKNLSNKIKATLKASDSNPDHTTFLGHFGTFHTTNLPTKEVSTDAMVLEEIQDLRRMISRSSHREQKLQSSNHSLIRETAEAIKTVAKEKGWKTKTAIRSNEEFFQNRVEDIISAPQHFSGPQEYRQFFKSIFHSIY